MFKLFVIGNLTADPVLYDREWTDKETGEVLRCKVCNFTVAADDGFGPRKQTQFFRINAWRGLGETCAEYLKKGRQVYVSGPVTLNNYVDKNKNLRATMEVRAEAVEFLNGGVMVKATAGNTAEEPVEEALY